MTKQQDFLVTARSFHCELTVELCSTAKPLRREQARGEASATFKLFYLGYR